MSFGDEPPFHSAHGPAIFDRVSGRESPERRKCAVPLGARRKRTRSSFPSWRRPKGRGGSRRFGVNRSRRRARGACGSARRAISGPCTRRVVVSRELVGKVVGAVQLRSRHVGAKGVQHVRRTLQARTRPGRRILRRGGDEKGRRKGRRGWVERTKEAYVAWVEGMYGKVARPKV
jgi:hypothetical protein